MSTFQQQPPSQEKPKPEPEKSPDKAAQLPKFFQFVFQTFELSNSEGFLRRGQADLGAGPKGERENERRVTLMNRVTETRDMGKVDIFPLEEMTFWVKRDGSMVVRDQNGRNELVVAKLGAADAEAFVTEKRSLKELFAGNQEFVKAIKTHLQDRTLGTDDPQGAKITLKERSPMEEDPKKSSSAVEAFERDFRVALPGAGTILRGNVKITPLESDGKQTTLAVERTFVGSPEQARMVFRVKADGVLVFMDGNKEQKEGQLNIGSDASPFVAGTMSLEQLLDRNEKFQAAVVECIFGRQERDPQLKVTF